jgi:hypothetical protein
MRTCHMVKAENVEEYRSALKHVMFAWIEGIDIEYTVSLISYNFQEVIEILNVHTNRVIYRACMLRTAA